MAFQISFTGLNDLKALNRDDFHALNDGADIREITRQLISELSNEAARVFGYDPITVQDKWLQIQWDLSKPISVFYNAGIYSASGKLIYSPLFLADAVNHFGKDTLVGILGHEVGHRMVYLLLTRKGISVSSWQNELCADYIAGILLRLGICQIQGMLRFYRTVCREGSRSHPPGNLRADFFLKGYRMVDRKKEAVFLRVPQFSKAIDTRYIFTADFMRRCLTDDVIRAGL